MIAIVLIEAGKPWLGAWLFVAVIVVPAGLVLIGTVADGHPLWTWFLAIVLVAGGTVLTVSLPTVTKEVPGLVHESAGVADLVDVLVVMLAAVTVWMAGKLILLTRASRLAMTRYRQAGSQGERPRLLPSRRSNLEELVQHCVPSDPSAPGRLVSIDGQWGEGKTFLIDRMKDEFSPRDGRAVGNGHLTNSPHRAVVVTINIWQQQTEHDLQAAVLQELMAVPAYFRGVGWIHFPMFFLWAKTRAVLHSLRLRVLYGGASVDVDLALPPLSWQSSLERLTSRVARRGIRTIIVLDDADRAPPLITQTALTLARRSFTVPGVSVVVANNEPLVRYKAFTPQPEMLRDLESTLEGAILDLVTEDSGPGGLAAFMANAHGPDVLASVLSTSTAGSDLAGAKRQHDDLSPRSLVRRITTLAYLHATKSMRDRIHERASEKYAGDATVRLRRLDAADMADMVTLPEFSVPIGRLMGRLPDAKELNELSTAVFAVFSLNFSDGRPRSDPPLRRYLNYLQLKLEEAGAKVSTSDAFRTEEIAALIALAWTLLGALW